MNAPQRVVIFAGPSLPPALRPADAALHWCPPVRQGEVYRAARACPAIIGIIDGYFEVTPTVWHKEILWAMTHGIHVYGSASIGALRAAELHTFGMKGVGRIFEVYRDGILSDDDEVAVLHGPEEAGYPSITEAMVNIRATLDRAVLAGVLDRWLVPRLIEIGKGLFYKERNWDPILQIAATRGLPPMPLNDFATWLPAGRVDQKRSDALQMINAIRARLAVGVTPLKVSYQFHDTGYHRGAQQSAEKRSSQTDVFSG
ncbi:MAG: TfuA-like protein [Stellaceae bacterium]